MGNRARGAQRKCPRWTLGARNQDWPLPHPPGQWVVTPEGRPKGKAIRCKQLQKPQGRAEATSHMIRMERRHIAWFRGAGADGKEEEEPPRDLTSQTTPTTSRQMTSSQEPASSISHWRRKAEDWWEGALGLVLPPVTFVVLGKAPSLL